MWNILFSDYLFYWRYNYNLFKASFIIVSIEA